MVVSAMAKVYYELIKAGRKTIDQVPLKQRQAVIDLLKSMGLDENGNPIEEVIEKQPTE